LAIGEFELISRYFERPCDDRDLLLGIGDDAAVVRADGALAVAVDTLVAGVHFPLDLPSEAVAYRALAVNLSDMAAMGAEPRWCTLALTLPDADEDWVGGFADGLLGLAERFGVALIGGDLTRGPLTISVQIIGTLAGAAPLTRAGGHIGDDVYVTGSLGDAAAGLALLTDAAAASDPDSIALKDRFLRPTPRVAAGRALISIASAAIDVSDGLLADLGHICAASDCGAEIDVEHLPISAEMLSLFSPNVAESYALGGGDDYELCFTAAPAQAASVEAALRSADCPVRRIGHLVAGTGVDCRRDGQRFDPAVAGYTHF
jgi:thiamine-monophosphate kinase